MRYLEALVVLAVASALTVVLWRVVGDYVPTCGNPTHHGAHTHE